MKTNWIIEHNNRMQTLYFLKCLKRYKSINAYTNSIREITNHILRLTK